MIQLLYRDDHASASNPSTSIKRAKVLFDATTGTTRQNQDIRERKEVEIAPLPWDNPEAVDPMMKKIDSMMRETMTSRANISQQCRRKRRHWWAPNLTLHTTTNETEMTTMEKAPSVFMA